MRIEPLHVASFSPLIVLAVSCGMMIMNNVVSPHSCWASAREISTSGSDDDVYRSRGITPQLLPARRLNAESSVVYLLANSFSSLVFSIKTANNSPQKKVVVNVTANIVLTSSLPKLKNGSDVTLVGGATSCKDSSGKATRCTIDGKKKFPIFVAGKIFCRVGVENLRITNARNGVVSGPCNVVLRNSDFVNNWSAIGGGVINDAYGPSLTTVQITKCTFQGNGASSKDGGVIYGQSNGSIRDVYAAFSTFSDNVALKGNGGAITVLFGGGTIRLRGCRFTNNSAYLNGGALHVLPDFFYSIDSSFLANVALTGEGGFLSVPSYPEINAQFCNTQYNNNKAVKFARSNNIFFTGDRSDGVASLEFCKAIPPAIYGLEYDRGERVVKWGILDCEGCTGCQFDCNKKGTCKLDIDFNPSCTCSSGYDPAISCLYCLPFADVKTDCKSCFKGFIKKPDGSCVPCPGITEIPYLQPERLPSSYGSSILVKTTTECQAFFDQTKKPGSPHWNVWAFFDSNSTPQCATSCVTFSAETIDICNATSAVKTLPKYNLYYKADESEPYKSDACS